MIALLHNPSSTNPGEITSFVSIDDAITYISIPWQVDPLTRHPIFPWVGNSCGLGACAIIGDKMVGGETIGEQCLCKVSVTETPGCDCMPTREEVLSSLHIESADPDAYSGHSLFMSTQGWSNYHQRRRRYYWAIIL